MKQLKNQVVVITGGSSGLGEAIANAVAEQGGMPILVARSTDKLQDISTKLARKYGIEVPFFSMDIMELEQVKEGFRQIVSRYPTIDVLINNAGYGVIQSFLDTSEEEFERMMSVNYLGTVYCTKQILPHMLQRGKGHIITIASQAGKVPTPKSSAYTATKHAVLGFTHSLRLELRGLPIYVTAVNPGPIQTPFFDLADLDGSYVKRVERYMLQPDYVADRIVQLIHKPKRELNLPHWMEWGSRLMTLFPTLMEAVAGRFIYKK